MEGTSTYNEILKPQFFLQLDGSRYASKTCNRHEQYELTDVIFLPRTDDNNPGHSFDGHIDEWGLDLVVAPCQLRIQAMCLYDLRQLDAIQI